jgi:hypothetical protein
MRAFVTIVFLICSNNIVVGQAATSESGSPPAGSVATAQPSVARQTSPPAEKVMYWQVGVTVTPTKWPIKGGSVRIPIPAEWPEQKILLYSEESGSEMNYQEKVLDGGLPYLDVNVPAIAMGDKAELLLTYQITLNSIPPPVQTQYFKIPADPDSALTPYLRSTMLIDSKHGSIKKLVAEVTKDAPHDWAALEAIYQWVWTNIELTAGEPVGAVKTLAGKKGAREDRVNLFVALCRAAKVPARTVWTRTAEYAEFYMIDDAGEGRWFPCHFSGAREFGSLTNLQVIEQKGDEFKLPGSNDKRRFVNATADIETVRNGRSDPVRPSVQFIHRPLLQPPAPK